MNNIKKLRTKFNLTQSQLAELMGCSQGSIGHYETGRRTPDIEDARLLVGVFSKYDPDVNIENIFPRQTQQGA